LRLFEVRLNAMRTILPPLLLAFALVPWAAATSTARDASIQVAADVTVSADGVATPGEFVPEVPAALQLRLQDRVRSWSFEPAKRDGKPVAAQSGIVLQLRMHEAGEKVSFVIEDAWMAPRTLTMVAPVYPVDAVRHRRQGDVRLEAIVDPSGVARSVRVATPSEWAQLDRAATRAVEQWRFQPEVVDGTPISTRVLVPISFRISDGNASPRRKLSRGVESIQEPATNPDRVIADAAIGLRSNPAGAL
jgi:TonB family protein